MGSFSELDEPLSSAVSYEIAQIDRLLGVYADLLERVRRRTPDLVELAALGAVLQCFYNGLENIFGAVAVQLDKKVPDGAEWHHDLLAQMTRTSSNRGPVISAAAADKLTDYLGFRHFFRHAHLFYLDWGRMSGLVFRLSEVWSETQRQIRRFLETQADTQG
jgi:hypothetical protein